MAEREYTAAEVDRAAAAIADADRVRHAQEVVSHLAPQLQRILNTALEEGDYFGNAHAAGIRAAASEEDLEERVRRMATLVAEEVRLGMLVGVAVGFELRRELEAAEGRPSPSEPAGGTPAERP